MSMSKEIGYFRLWWLPDESEGRDYIDKDVYSVCGMFFDRRLKLSSIEINIWEGEMNQRAIGMSTVDKLWDESQYESDSGSSISYDTNEDGVDQLGVVEM